MSSADGLERGAVLAGGKRIPPTEPEARQSPRRARGPDGFSPSRKEAARREQAQRDNKASPQFTLLKYTFI